MSVRPLIAMCLLILCAVTTGCGTSAEPNAETERLAGERKAEAEKRAAKQKAEAEKRAAEQKAAAEKKAAEEKAAANSYVKVQVEVELRGVLSCTEEAVTVTISTTEPEFREHKWVLDFGEDKEIRAKAKGFDGKTVLVKGSAILRVIKSTLRYERREKTGPVEVPVPPLGVRPAERGREIQYSPPIEVGTALDLEPKIAVKSLVAAPK